MHHQAQASYFTFHVPSYSLGLSVVSSTFVAPSSVWDTEEEGASGSKVLLLGKRELCVCVWGNQRGTALPASS